MATTNDQQYAEQLNVLQAAFPQAPTEKLIRLLRRFNGDAEQVNARLAQRELRGNKFDDLEARFGAAVTALQQEDPSIQSFRRFRLLKIMERFNGDIGQVRNVLQNAEVRHHDKDARFGSGRRQQREELQTKYATQLAELATAGIDVNHPCTFRQLRKTDGNVNLIIEKMLRRTAKKEKFAELDTKYVNEIAQLQADGVEIKNKRVLARLLEKSNGQVDAVKQLINERKEKHQKRKEYRQKHHRCKSPNATEGNETGASTWRKRREHHRCKSPNTAEGNETGASTWRKRREHHRCKSPNTTEGNETGASTWRKRRELSSDELENLKRLRSAGVHGNPMKILKTFHECNDSIEMTVARTQENRERCVRTRNERILKRTLLNEAQNSYITLNNREDWPSDIEQVYLDGNNMMFVVDSLRRLCLNRAGQKTERAIGEIASAWNEKVHIPNVELIFDSTRQLDQIGTIKISSAQPKYRTTDDMLIEIARRPENQAKNKRTIIITSDRALAALLQREGCLIVKPYNWFAHCVMTLTPDLINYEEVTGTMTTASTPTTVKIRYNFDELVHRIANIDL